MKHILISILLMASTTHAVTSVECRGPKPSDSLQFTIASPEMIVLTGVDQGLYEHGGGIFESNEQASLSRNVTYNDQKIELYANWGGNWGYELRIPKAIVQGNFEAGQKFNVVYHFIYSDIAESNFFKTLKCTVK